MEFLSRFRLLFQSYGMLDGVMRQVSADAQARSESRYLATKSVQKSAYLGLIVLDSSHLESQGRQLRLIPDFQVNTKIHLGTGPTPHPALAGFVPLSPLTNRNVRFGLRTFACSRSVASQTSLRQGLFLAGLLAYSIGRFGFIADVRWRCTRAILGYLLSPVRKIANEAERER
jgi:hypothetical protein